jgi:hypothetical protein
MIAKCQFSLAFLLFEMSCIAAALAMFKTASMYNVSGGGSLFAIGGVATIGVAIGGPFGRPLWGAALTIAIVFAVLIVVSVMIAVE